MLDEINHKKEYLKLIETQLEMSLSKAKYKLLRKIMYTYIVYLKLNTCHRCQDTINSVDSMSIEHKVPWRHSTIAKELFFDMDNITFSHVKCNNEFRRKSNEVINKISIEESIGLKDKHQAIGVANRFTLFKLIKLIGKDTCYRCQETFNDYSEYTIDHIVPWVNEPNAKELFFDVDNIAFSHSTCNKAVARQDIDKRSLGSLKTKKVNPVTGYLGVSYYTASKIYKSVLVYKGKELFISSSDSNDPLLAKLYDDKIKTLYPEDVIEKYKLTNESRNLIDSNNIIQKDITYNNTLNIYKAKKINPTSKFIGVRYNTKHDIFYSTIIFNGKTINIYRHKDPSLVAKEYDKVIISKFKYEDVIKYKLTNESRNLYENFIQEENIDQHIVTQDHLNRLLYTLKIKKISESSGYLGVMWHQSSNRFRSILTINRIKYIIGYDKDPSKLAKLYDDKIKTLYPEDIIETYKLTNSSRNLL
jgi:hypothetical protein